MANATLLPKDLNCSYLLQFGSLCHALPIVGQFVISGECGKKDKWETVIKQQSATFRLIMSSLAGAAQCYFSAARYWRSFSPR